MKITSRSKWGAKYRDGFGIRRLPATEIWLHNSVTATLPEGASVNQEIKEMILLEQIGQQRFGGGISYTYAVFQSGRVYEGHAVGKKGAHTMYHNTVGIAICMVGNFDVTEPSEAMLRSIAALCQHLKAKGYSTRDTLTGGHRDVYATACPGRYGYAAIGAINALAAGKALTSLAGSVEPLVTGPKLRPGDKGDHVEDLQKRILNWWAGSPARAIAESGGADGKFGPGTEKAVKIIQGWGGVKQDGIVGDDTHGVLATRGGTTPPLLKVGNKYAAANTWVQYGLMSKGGNIAKHIEDTGGADGKFGPGLERSVKIYQRSRKLDDDGVVGPDSWKALAKDGIYPGVFVRKD